MSKNENKTNIVTKTEPPFDKTKTYNDYAKIVTSINENDNMLTQEVFEILKKEIDNNQSTEFIDCAKQVLKDHSKILDKNITYEQSLEIIESEKAVLDKIQDEIKEKRAANEKTKNESLELDRKKSSDNWNKLKLASMMLIGLVSGGAALALGHKYIDKK